MAKVYEDVQFNPEIKRRSIVMIVLLSIVSLGVYVAYWLLVNRNWINGLTKEGHVTFITPLLLLLLYSMALFSLIPGNLLLNGLPLAFFHYIDSVIAYIGVALTLYMSFQMRRILNAYLQREEISHLLTLFFHVCYLQYKINKNFANNEVN